MRGPGLVLGGVLLVACGTATGGDSAEDNTAGMGVPQQFRSQAFPGERQPVQARVHLAANGCFLGSLRDADVASRYLIVWPADTEQGSSGDELQLRDGTAVRDGDLMVGDGLLLPSRELEGFGADSYWDFAVGFCTPEASEVLVLDSVVKR